MGKCLKVTNNNHIDEVMYYMMARPKTRTQSCTILCSHRCKDLRSFMEWLNDHDFELRQGYNYFVVRDCGYLSYDA